MHHRRRLPSLTLPARWLTSPLSHFHGSSTHTPHTHAARYCDLHSQKIRLAIKLDRAAHFLVDDQPPPAALAPFTYTHANQLSPGTSSYVHEGAFVSNELTACSVLCIVAWWLYAFLTKSIIFVASWLVPSKAVKVAPCDDRRLENRVRCHDERLEVQVQNSSDFWTSSIEVRSTGRRLLWQINPVLFQWCLF